MLRQDFVTFGLLSHAIEKRGRASKGTVATVKSGLDGATRKTRIFGRSTQGIAFGAIDGAPSKLFFLLVAPTVTEHLAVLARLSRLLREPRLRQELLVVDAPKKALALIRDAEASL